MTENDLLSGIVASPKELDRWLILADWLEDHDAPRSELARLRYLHHVEPEHPEAAARVARQQALLESGLRPVVPTWTTELGMTFALILPGSFLMGSPPEEASRQADETQHWVTFTQGVFIGVYPVTQAQWQAIMGSNPSHFKGDQLPVENVSWDDCQELCKKLRERLGLPIRLPTEAEWEYACRAGMTTPFYFGGVLNGQQANCDGNHPYGTSTKGLYLRQTTDVGKYAANAWGLFDTIGNVWEWCQDGYRSDYENLAANDPSNNQSPTGRRVLRGGSWYNHAEYCRAARRGRIAAAYRHGYFGVRVCFHPD